MNRQTNKADRLRQIEEILWANPEGLTRAEIARRLGVERSTISRYIDSDDLPPDIFIDESDKDRLKLDRRLQITQIVVHNLRSLVDVTLDLKSLNVMIGPNGAGKTALMEVLLLLHSGANGDLSSFFDERGGFHSVISATTNQTGQPPMTVGARLAPPPHLGG
ncbi:MAG: AAA family ATPase, partial [Caldilinea sp.]|nr:AAA family ATPase [Caldilinea sp.]